MGRALAALALLATGVGAGFAIGLATRPETRTETVRTTTFEEVNGSRSAGVMPAPIPTVLQGSLDARGFALADTVPADANIRSADYVERDPRQLIVTWDREHLTRYGAAIWERNGLAIWQRDAGDSATWHRVYTFEQPVQNAVTVEGFRVTTGDISGDGRSEILVFFDTGGSAGNGVYHLFANAGRQLRQPLVKRLSSDEGTMSLANGALVVREGLGSRGPGIHCCGRKLRERWLRWDGHGLVTVRTTIRPNR